MAGDILALVSASGTRIAIPGFGIVIACPIATAYAGAGGRACGIIGALIGCKARCFCLDYAEIIQRMVPRCLCSSQRAKRLEQAPKTATTLLQLFFSKLSNTG
jgi:hypothetical protein